MPRVVYFIGLAVLATVCADDTSLLKCYFCESAFTPECETKPLSTLQVSCNELQYDYDARSMNGRTQNKHLAAIFKRESTRTLTNLENVEYRCIKVAIVEDNNRNFIRTCAPLKQNIANACDFIGEQIDTAVKVKDCYECAEDYCNTAFSFSSSVLIQLMSTILVWFLAQF